MQRGYKFTLDREAVVLENREYPQFRRFQSRVVLRPTNLLPFTNHLKVVYFVSLLAQHSLNYKHSSEANQKPYCFGPPWVCAKAPLGARLGSRHVGRQSRQSFYCSSSWVWEPNVL